MRGDPRIIQVLTERLSEELDKAQKLQAVFHERAAVAAKKRWAVDASSNASSNAQSNATSINPLSSYSNVCLLQVTLFQ